MRAIFVLSHPPVVVSASGSRVRPRDHATSKGRKQRITPLTGATAAIGRARQSVGGYAARSALVDGEGATNAGYQR
jgi:hypothetical protein